MAKYVVYNKLGEPWMTLNYSNYSRLKSSLVADGFSIVQIEDESDEWQPLTKKFESKENNDRIIKSLKLKK